MEEINKAIALVMLLRAYPDVFLRAFRLMGAMYPVVDMHGYPVADPLPNEEKSWSRDQLHAELEREISMENYTIRGFLTYLTAHNSLWRVSNLWEDG